MSDIFEQFYAQRSMQNNIDMDAANASAAQKEADLIAGVQQRRNEWLENRDKYQVDLDPEEYQILNNAISNADLPEDEAYRWATALEYNKVFGVSVSDAYTNLEKYNAALWGENKSFIPKTNFKAIVDYGKLGKNTLRQGFIGNAVMKAEMTGDTEELEKLLSEYEAIDAENKTLADNQDRRWFIEALKYGAQSAPFTGYVATAGLIGGLVSGGLGTGLAFAASMQNAMGLEYMDLRKEGASKENALFVSALSGSLQALVETASGNVAGILGKNALGAAAKTKMIEKVTGNLFKRLHYDGTFLKLALNMGSEYIKENFEEGMEEVFQDLISKGSHALAAEFEGYGIEPMTAESIAKDAWENFRGGVMGSLTLGLVGTAVKTHGTIADYKAIKDAATNIPSEELFKKAVEKSPIFENMSDEERKETINQIWVNNKGKRAEELATTEEELAEVYDAEDQEEMYDIETDEEGNVVEANLKEAEPEQRGEDNRLYSEMPEFTENEDGTLSGEMYFGDKEGENPKVYGHLKFTVDTEKNQVNITEFKTKYSRDYLRNEMYADFSQQMAGFDINWNPVGKLAKQIKENITGLNPRGKKMGMNYFQMNTDGHQNTRVQIAQELRANLNSKKVTNEMIAPLVAEFEALGNTFGYNITDFYQKVFNGKLFGTKEELNAKAEMEGAGPVRGGLTYWNTNGMLDGLRAVIYAAENSDFSTFSHELAHLARIMAELENGDLIKEMNAAFNIGEDGWTVEKEELFAETYEDYLHTGKAENNKLKELFQKLAEFLVRTMHSLNDKVKISDDIKKVYDKLLNADDSVLHQASEAALSLDEKQDQKTETNQNTEEESFEEREEKRYKALEKFDLNQMANNIKGIVRTWGYEVDPEDIYNQLLDNWDGTDEDLRGFFMQYTAIPEQIEAGIQVAKAGSDVQQTMDQTKLDQITQEALTDIIEDPDLPIEDKAAAVLKANGEELQKEEIRQQNIAEIEAREDLTEEEKAKAKEEILNHDDTNGDGTGIPMSLAVSRGLYQKELTAEEKKDVSLFQEAVQLSLDLQFDEDATEKELAEAINELDNIQKVKTNKVWSIVRDMKMHKGSEIIGNKVDVSNRTLTATGWDQLREILDIYRNKSFETFRYVLINRYTGEIYKQYAVTSKMPAESTIFPSDRDFGGYINGIVREAYDNDCGIAYVHNHPSGRVRPSNADISLTKFLRESPIYMGHMILDHNSYNLNLKEDVDEKVFNQHVLNVEETKDPLYKGVKEHKDVLSNAIRDSIDLNIIAKRLNDVSLETVPVFFTNVDYKIVALAYYSESDFDGFSLDKTVEKLKNTALRNGAYNIFTVVQKPEIYNFIKANNDVLKFTDAMYDTSRLDEHPSIWDNEKPVSVQTLYQSKLESRKEELLTEDSEEEKAIKNLMAELSYEGFYSLHDAAIKSLETGDTVEFDAKSNHNINVMDRLLNSNKGLMFYRNGSDRFKTVTLNIHPDQEGKYQVTYWDALGPILHVIRNDAEGVLDELEADEDLHVKNEYEETLFQGEGKTKKEWEERDNVARSVLPSLFNKKETKRILKNFDRLYMTPWHKQAIESILIRADMEDLFAKRPMSHNSKLGAPSASEVANAIKGGLKEIEKYIKSTGIIGHAEKAGNAINSTYLSCEPSEDCARFCYAVKGNYAFPSPAVKSELISWYIEKHTKSAAKMIIDEYVPMLDYEAGKALRLFDKGDISEKWLPLIEELNARDIHTHIFSKRPEILRKVDPKKNVIMLSIDKSNIEMAFDPENKDLPIAFVYSDISELKYIEKLKDRFLEHGGTILPVKEGEDLLINVKPEAMEALIKLGWTERYLCPVDRGTAVLRTSENPDELPVWYCGRCNTRGGIGCFYHRVTALRAKLEEIDDRPLNEREKGEFDEQITELRKFESDPKYGSIIRAELANILLKIGEGIDPETEAGSMDQANSVLRSKSRNGETSKGNKRNSGIEEETASRLELGSNTRFQKVTDPEEIARLEKEETVKAYRAAQIIDGKIYPPMSAEVDGELRDPIELNAWERSDENPELATDDGYFPLDKGNGKTIWARYNPYFHSSPTMLNDQFASAQDRPNLITLEVEIPVSELNSENPYHAEKAKDSVGTVEWKAGIIQSMLSGKRTVNLTRWDKPVRIVPDSEVADNIFKSFGGKKIIMPSNVVSPNVRKELEDRGIQFVETNNKGKLIDGENAGKTWSRVYGAKAKNTLFQTAYHGTSADFDKFDLNYGLSGEGSMSFGYGVYVSGSEEIARDYATRQQADKNGAQIINKIDFAESSLNAWEYQLKKLPSRDEWLKENQESIDRITKRIEKFKSENKNVDTLEEILNRKLQDNTVEGYEKNKARLENGIKEAKKNIEDLKAELNELNSKGKAERHLYTLEIPDDRFIKWDKNARRSTVDKVHNALFRKLAYEPNEDGEYSYKGVENELRRELDDVFNNEYTGRSLYGTASSYLGGDKNASMFLSSIGYKGIDYPAGTNFGSPEKDARNFVIFNENDARIIANTLFQQEEEVRQQYINTDKWMKTPDGYDTNLTEKQWLQVRTPNFKAWFGDWENDPDNASKVLDENGEPLVVYHGTNSKTKFEIFNTKSEEHKDNIGSHFGPKETAKEFSKDNIYEVFLNIKKPFIPNFDFFADIFDNTYLSELIHLRKEINSEEANKIFDKIYDIYPNIKEFDIANMDDGDVLEVFEDDEHLDAAPGIERARDKIVDLMLEMMAAGGYDGMKYENWYEGEDNNECYVALEPNQIKSATDNSGAFDNANPSILFQPDEDILNDAAQFDSWVEFMEYAQTFGYEGIPLDASSDWYLNTWEIAHNISPTSAEKEAERLQKRDEQWKQTGADPITLDTLWLEMIRKPGGLESFMRRAYDLTHIDEQERATMDPDENALVNTIQNRVDNIFRNGVWKSEMIRVHKGKEIIPSHRKQLLTFVQNRTRDYRALYGTLFNDPKFAVPEAETGDIQEASRAIRNHLVNTVDEWRGLSPERKNELLKYCDDLDIRKKFKQDRVKMSDDEVDAYVDLISKDLTKLAKEMADMRTDFLNEINDLAGMQERDILRQYAEFENLEAEAARRNVSLPKGSKDAVRTGEKYKRNILRGAGRTYNDLAAAWPTFKQEVEAKYRLQEKLRSENRIQELEEKIRAEYDARKAKVAINKAERLNAIQKEYADKRAQAQAVRELRDMRKKLVKSVMRRVDFNRIAYEQARDIIAIQKVFEPNLYGGINKWIGTENKLAREIWSAWNTDIEAKEKMLERLSRKGKTDLIQKLEETLNEEDFETKWTNKDKKELEKVMPKQDWIRELNLDVWKDERDNAIQLPIRQQVKTRMVTQPDGTKREVLVTFAEMDPEVEQLIQSALGWDMAQAIQYKFFEDWTTGEMEELARRINDLYKQGRDRLAARKEAERRQADRIRSEIQEAIENTGIHINDDDPEDVKKKKQDKINKILGISHELPGTAANKNEKQQTIIDRLLHSYHDANVRRVARILDNYHEAVMTDLLYWQENECFNRQQRSIDRRNAKIDKVIEENKIDIKDLGKVYYFNDAFHFTYDEILMLWAAQLNQDEYTAEQLKDNPGMEMKDVLEESSYQAIVYGNMITPEERDAAIKQDNAIIEAEKARLDALHAAELSGDQEEIARLQQRPSDSVDLAGNILMEGTINLKNTAKSRYNAILEGTEDIRDAYKPLIDAIRQDYAEEFDRINRTSIEEFNAPVWREKWYLPLVRLTAAGDTHENRLKQDLLMHSVGTGKAGTEKGFTKKRKEIGPLHQTPVELGLYTTWADSVERNEHFIAYAAYVRELNRVLFSKDSLGTMQELENRYGKGMKDYLEAYVKEVANPNTVEPKKGLDRVMHMMRGNTAPAYLGWKFSSILKQGIESPAPFMQFINPAEYLHGCVQLATKKWTRESIAQKSAFMQSRVFDPIADLINENVEKSYNKKSYYLKKFQQKGMEGLEWIDWACVAPGWIAIYEKEYARLQAAEQDMYDARVAQLKEQNEARSYNVRLSEEEINRMAMDDVMSDIEIQAVNKADDCVRLCQPSNRKVDLAPMFKNNSEAAKAVLQFQTALNVIWQNIRYDIPYAIKNQQYQNVVGMVLGYIMAGVMSGVITKGIIGGGDDEPDASDIARRLAFYTTTQFIDSVPIMGGTLDGLTEKVITGNGSGMMNNSIFPTFQKYVNGVSSLASGDFLKAARSMEQGMQLTLGLPYSGIREIEAMLGIFDGEEGLDFYPQALAGRRK